MDKVQKFGVIFNTEGADFIIPCVITKQPNIYMLLQDVPEFGLYSGDRIKTTIAKGKNGNPMEYILFKDAYELALFNFACSECGVTSINTRVVDWCPVCGGTKPISVTLRGYISPGVYIDIYKKL